MATYTIELRTLIDSPNIEIFDFDYPFYINNKQAKEEFEALFLNHYYLHEIGAETITRWKHQLKSRLTLIMPYYEQLYQTQWNVVNKDMMLSKDLTETTTRTIEMDGTTSGNTTGKTKADISNIGDGVSVVNLQEGNKTGTSEGSTNSESQAQTKTKQTESFTFTSQGDIGIQTPAYAITEWRKVIININQRLIEDCKDLFMQIY